MATFGGEKNSLSKAGIAEFNILLIDGEEQDALQLERALSGLPCKVIHQCAEHEFANLFDSRAIDLMLSNSPRSSLYDREVSSNIAKSKVADGTSQEVNLELPVISLADFGENTSFKNNSKLNENGGALTSNMPALRKFVIEKLKTRENKIAGGSSAPLEAQTSPLTGTIDPQLLQFFHANHSPSMLLSRDTIVDVNASAHRYFSHAWVTCEVGESVLEYMPIVLSTGHTSRALWQEMICRCEMQGYVEFACEFLQRKAGNQPVKITLTQIDLGSGDCMIAIITDLAKVNALEFALASEVEQQALQADILQLSFNASELGSYLAQVLPKIANAPFLPLERLAAIYFYDEREENLLSLTSGYGLPHTFWHDYAELQHAQSAASHKIDVPCFLPIFDLIPGLASFPFGDHAVGGVLALKPRIACELTPEHYNFIHRVVGQINIAAHRFQAETKLKHMASHHDVTGLPNRRALVEWAGEWWEDHKRYASKRFLVIVEIENIKQIRDSLGHREADRILQAVALRMREFSGVDQFLAHLAGDLFCFVDQVSQQGNDKLRTQGEELVKNIKHHLSFPFNIDGHQIYINPIFGVAEIPHAGQVEDLIVHAEIALNVVKKVDNQFVVFYDPQMSVAVVEKLYLENDLRRAISEEKLQLYFQPQINPSSGDVEGCEALLRWQADSGEWISPAKFIPIAEECGLIYAIGDLVLKRACESVKHWSQQSQNLVPVSVNISAAQLAEEDFVAKVRSYIEAYEISPQLLELEVTETLAVKNSSNIIAKLLELRSIGVSIAMDDFGTGYSSLNYLQMFPLTKLKIDRAFVKDIGRNDDGAVARFIANLAHDRRIKIVVEGVEDEFQKNFFTQLRCDLIQGFYYHKPMPLHEFLTLISATE